VTSVHENPSELNSGVEEAARIFAGVIGITDIQSRTEEVGSEVFLKFCVGRPAPIYDHALRVTQKSLPEENPFRGLLNLVYEKVRKFPHSLEADVLQAFITRETRRVVQRERTGPLSISNLSFQNREDLKIIQPATHLLVGRRGVGKSTLIRRAADLLEKANKICVVMDMQAYSDELSGQSLCREVLHDFSRKLVESGQQGPHAGKNAFPADELQTFADRMLKEKKRLPRAIPELNRLVARTSAATDSDVFLFLDDYHLLDHKTQPELLHLLHGTLKGAGGWLKVAGLRTRLHSYDARTRRGLQTPGDAQLISLDFTLVDPGAAETHLRAILKRFLSVVGVENETHVIHDKPFRRLVWANAGVPRDFLQMFGKALEHARRANRATVTLTDVNLSIGESGQQKMDDLEQDARNEQNTLKRAVKYLEEYCLVGERAVNGFLVRCEQGPEKRAIDILCDLRLVHLVHPTITPHKAGERYEAYLVDYSLFTGFRRRRNIKELLPADGRQFKAKELRQIPVLRKGFLSAEE